MKGRLSVLGASLVAAAMLAPLASGAPAPIQYASEDAVDRYLVDKGLDWVKPRRIHVEVLDASCVGKGTWRNGPRDEFDMVTKLYKKFVCYVTTPSASYVALAFAIGARGIPTYQWLR